MRKLTFAHISDMHLPGSELSPVMQKVMQAGGDPLANVTACLEELADIKPDFLIATGDMVHEGGPEHYEALRSLINQYLPKTPVLASMGNHDVRDAFRKGFLGDSYGGGHPYCETFVMDGLRFISIDSAYEKGIQGDIGEDQLDWMQNVLSQPCRRGNILVCHHPLMSVIPGSAMEIPPRFERLIRGGNFVAIFNGHIHGSYIGKAIDTLQITGESLGFGITLKGDKVEYTTRAAYNLCIIDEEGDLHVEHRTVFPKPAFVLMKEFGK